jgi:hypothetical protein
MAIHFSTPLDFEPINYKQKENSQKLSHINPATRWNRVDLITLFAIDMLALQRVV